MDPRTTNDPMLLLAPGFSRQAEEVLAIRLAAARARDAAIAAGIRRAATVAWEAFSVLAQAVVTWPERRRTYENLRALTDRELADIGLNRGDITHVFDPDFQMPHRAPAAEARLAPATQPA